MLIKYGCELIINSFSLLKNVKINLSVESQPVMQYNPDEIRIHKPDEDRREWADKNIKINVRFCD